MNTVLFDMDGTLLNTLQDLQTSVNYALERFDLPLISLDETRLAAGYGSVVLIEKVTKRVFPTGSPQFQQVFDDFNAHYAEHRNDTTCPYPGILELLEALKQRDIKMAVVSNKIQRDTEALRQRWFADYISVAVGRVEGIPAKPAPDMALVALRQLGSTPQEAICLGDSEPDAQLGQNAGCTSVCCTWGFRTRDVLEQLHPAYIINEPHELLAIVDSLR